MEPFQFLQDWFAQNCDGDWEHTQGITIRTLDNPGWTVTINLIDTELESHAFPTIERNIDSDEDWIRCWVEASAFRGVGGPRNLAEILGVFQRWASSTV
jgi:hypothetical protein